MKEISNKKLWQSLYHSAVQNKNYLYAEWIKATQLSETKKVEKGVKNESN